MDSPSARVLTTAAAIDPDEWDGLCGPNTLARHRWLRLAEAVLADHQPRYLLVRRDGRLVAAAVATLEHRLQNARLQSLFGGLLRRRPYLHVGVPLTGVAGLLVASPESPASPGSADPADGLAGLLREVRAFVARERLLFCLVDHLPPQHPAWAAQRGFHRIAWWPETRLELGHSSYEQYLADLPRKKRQEIGRMSRRAGEEGIAVRRLTPAAGTGPTLDRLVDNVLRRHGDTQRFGPDLFGTAATVLGDDLTLLAAHRDDELVGCVALLRDGDDLVVRWIGRDYERTGDTNAYHALVAACVRTGIALGARSLHLGAAAYETKKQFGVRLEERGRLFAARSRAVNWGLRRVRGRLDPARLE